MPSTFRITRPRNPLYQFVPSADPKPLTLRQVLWSKMLRWIDQEPIGKILKTLLRVALGLLLLFAIFAPHPTLRLLLALARWRSYRVPITLMLLFVTLNLKRCWLLVRRRRLRPKGENQHTFNGIPVGSLASFLTEHNGFKFEDATQKLALPRRQYDKIADELEQHGILVRGEKNARVLRPITLEQLVTQLRDRKFPLVWDEARQEWLERDGPFNRWVLKREHEEKKRDEQIARKERKLERKKDEIELLDQEIEQKGRLASIFPEQTAG
jgi:hypothetical protein